MSRGVRLRRVRRFAVAGLVCAAGLAAMAAGIRAIPQGGDSSILLVCGGLVAVVGALLFYVNASQIVSGKRITRDHLWIKGVHPDFLSELPEWAGENGAGQAPQAAPERGL